MVGEGQLRPGERNSKCKICLSQKVPIIQWLPLYTTKWLLHDLLAGFTVALTEIPQSIAYAGIAGLPLQYGLYSSFMGGFMYAIFGSCKAINMGATSILALLIQPHVAKIGVAASIFMSFISGIIILVFGLAKLGFIIEFFSFPVMSGFTSAAALTIATSQLNNFLGLSAQASGFLTTWKFVFEHVGDIHIWDCVLGITTLGILFFLKEIGVFTSQKNTSKCVKKTIFLLSIAKNAIVVVVGMVLAYFLTVYGGECFKLTGSVQGGLPHLTIPPFARFEEILKEFGISIIFIPLVAILETIAIGKVFSKGKPLDASQEMIALGIANLTGCFVLSMPVTGSFTRTAVNIASGAKTNMAGVFTGVTILVALQFLTETFQYIPKATLAAVIICAMFYVFDFGAPLLFWKTSKLDLIPYVVTLLSSLFISLEYGILIGIATNLAFVLYAVARPQYQLKKVEIPNCKAYLIMLPGTVHFPAVEHLKRSVLGCDESGVFIVIDGALVQKMDITVAKSISSLVVDTEIKNQKILFLNFQKAFEKMCIDANHELTTHFKNGDVKDVLYQERPSLMDGVYVLEQY